MFENFGINAGFVEDEYHRYLENPQLVHESWRIYFDKLQGQGSESFSNGGNGTSAYRDNGHGTPNNGGSAAQPVASTWGQNGTARIAGAVMLQAQVTNLINAYRQRGHYYADINPLSDPPARREELDLASFGLDEGDLDKNFSTNVALHPTMRLRDLVDYLDETYCRSIGVEVMQIEEIDQRTWLLERMEATKNRMALSTEEQLRILARLTDAEVLEQFIHKSYAGAKRFSLEGAESLIPLLDLLVERAADEGVEEIILGMAHRGRLNVLCNIMGKNVRELFAAFDDVHPERSLGSGDVKYHLGYSCDRATQSGRTVHLSLAFNPSHLEFVNPVVEGRVRAKQDERGDDKRTRVMPLLIHGDAAFMGQGVVAETLNLMALEGYATGGTIHVIVNNQIGFTTDPSDARSTRYASDMARMLKSPVFHVNGEDPEAVAHVTTLATEFRQKFGKDVVIDMYCYRKWGHNEGDEPRFTQPLMYQTIDTQPSVRETYIRRMVDTGKITVEQATEIATQSRAQLSAALEETRKGDWYAVPNAGGGLWQGYRGGAEADTPDVPTGLPEARLLELLRSVSVVPEGFNANPKALRLMRERLEKAERGQALDWAAGETLAYAAILSEGSSIRLSGQDCRRGTFSHRHAVLRDADTGRFYTPLQSVAKDSARFDVWDSPLSETGVLGFDYGYSLDSPHKLVIWEAQFGDFSNGAQVIIDQFIAAAEDKWHRLSGITLLLPHAYEGQGPEHSSARLERFLNLAAEDNIQVCNLTTPAQIHHALRRQIVRPLRKPLVIMSPKSLLRNPAATSTLAEMANGTFQRVIADQGAQEASAVRKVLLCSGKIYYELAAEREKRGATDIAILRLEQLYPVGEDLVNALAPYRDGTPLVWVQDEPLNMGAWYFVNARLPGILGHRLPLSCISRAESASPATGSPKAHLIEQGMILKEAFEP
jgi:2-oxoglutarate dehydrogenase E1 component